MDKDRNLAKKLQKKLNLTWLSLGRFQTTDTDIQALFNIKAVPYRIILDQEIVLSKRKHDFTQTSGYIDSL